MKKKSGGGGTGQPRRLCVGYVDHAAECTDAQAKIPARRGGRTYSLLLGDPPREVSEVECVQRVTGDTDMADSKGYTTTEADARRLFSTE